MIDCSQISVVLGYGTKYYKNPEDYSLGYTTQLEAAYKIGEAKQCGALYLKKSVSLHAH